MRLFLDIAPKQLTANLPHIMDGPEILVGIDFGTTYSGVSWAVNAGVRRIQLITDWPSAKDEITQLEKVPSLISIDGRYPDERRWGFEADKNHSPAWFKLWLDPSLHGTSPLGSFVMGSNSPVSNDMFRNAQQATVDYLRCLWSHAGGHIRRQVGSSSFEAKLVLTVPAMWSPTAIQTLQMAAIKAGLPEDIHILPEPEAALHHILHEERHLLTPEIAKGDVYTVCDAGGATVNVITYIVSSVKPLIVSQYVPAQGGLCGATFIDMHFEEYVKTKVGEEAYTRLKDASKAQMMHDFERQLKRGFRGDVRGNAGVRLDGVEDNPKMGMFNERIYITEDSLRAIFDPVCNEVARLVEEQIRVVRRKGRQVKRVFLVGGFGANPYLRQVISNKVKIRVVQAIDTWSSICRGATSWLLDCLEQDPPGRLLSRTGTPKTARYSYGVALLQADSLDRRRTFSSERSITRGRRTPEIGRARTEKQMLWLVRKGDMIKLGSREQHEIHDEIQITTRWYHIFLGPNRSYNQELQIFYSAMHPPPQMFDDAVPKFCTVPYTIKLARLRRAMYRVRKTASGKYNVALELAMEMGPEHVVFVVSCDGLEVGRRQVSWEPAGARERQLEGNVDSLHHITGSSSPIREKGSGIRMVMSEIELRR